MDFTGVIAKINPFFIIFMEISPYFEAEKVHFPFSVKISYEQAAP
jgi:hypothetical protein